MPSLEHVRPQDNRIHSFIQQLDLGTILTTSNVGSVTAAQSFTLSQVPNNTAYVALFDQYRIREIEFWAYPAQSNNGGHTGTLYSAVDYDNAPALTPSTISQYSNVCMSPLTTMGHYHRFRPHVAVAAYSGAFTSFANQAAQWIDCSSATVQHYGIGLVSSTTTDNNIVIAGMVRFHLEFRNIL